MKHSEFTRTCKGNVLTPTNLELEVTQEASYGPMGVRHSHPSEKYSKPVSQESRQFMINRQGLRVFNRVCYWSVQQKDSYRDTIHIASILTAVKWTPLKLHE